MKQDHIPTPPMNLGAVLNLMEYLLCFKSIRDELKANLAMRLYVGRSSFTSREADEMADYILGMLKCCYFGDIIKEAEEREQFIRRDERWKMISEIRELVKSGSFSRRGERHGLMSAINIIDKQ